MEVKTVNKTEQAGEILEVLSRFSKADFHARARKRGGSTEMDAIIDGLNTLGEALQAKLLYVEENERRINEIMDVLLQYTLMDFTSKIPVSSKGDEIDAIIVGLNTLSEELDSNMRMLKESEERFRMVVEGVKDYAIFMLDENGYIMNWNKGAEHIKGYSAGDIIGKHFSIFYTPDEIEHKEPEHNLEMARKNGHYECEGWRVKKDGSRFWAEIVFTTLHDERGEIRGFSKITRDGTERKNFEAALERKAKELERSNRELEQFAYVASHDLQEPLRMVSSFLQLLEKHLAGKLDKEGEEFIDYAVDGSLRMKNMINDLLSYSRILSGKWEFERTDINKVLEEVQENLKESIAESGAVIEIGKMPTMKVDRIKMVRLFQNLIANALKFRKKDQVPRIEIQCHEYPGFCEFSVQDNGIGIKKEYHDKIFLIFQRLNPRGEYPGTGIGLAECLKIAELHKGRIWVESEEGKGSVFYFTINKNLSDEHANK